MERALSQLLAVILYLGCLAGISQQDVLTCSKRDLLPNGDFQDIRITDGYRSSDLVFLGSNQTLIVIDRDNDALTEDIGVCYTTSPNGCYQADKEVEECDNYIRSVTVLEENCTSNYCRVLVCGTNAMIPRCGICNYTNSMLNCSFTQNEPPQDLPFSGNGNYNSCLSANLGADEVFQFKKNDNASFLHVHQDAKIYFGHTKDESENVESEIGLASISEDGVISGVIKTTKNSQKMIAQDADLVGTPFTLGDYVYFLFREDSQESASSSVGQPYPLNTVRSRIARICKNDAGSSETLVSYLKQRLLCSKKSNEVWESKPYLFDQETPMPMDYNEIQDFEIKEKGSDRLIYAIFTNEQNAYPQSALCVFNLTAIDETFTTGNFFGSDGDVSNDLWREYDGSPVIPRHGKCSNPNTNANNFLRDYNLMDAPAVQIDEPPLTMVGDRFSNLEMTNDSYIISSERGCLYSFDIATSNGDLGDPCPLNDAIKESAIKDLESHYNGSYVVTTPDSSYGLSDCSQYSTCVETAVYPQAHDYAVRPNSTFNIYAEKTMDSITIKSHDGEINDGDYRLLRNETLDADESLVHFQILILNETIVAVTGCNGTVMEFNISLYKPDNYTENELKRRCDEWDWANETYTNLTTGNNACEDEPDPSGRFDPAVLITNNQAKACENCAYDDCTSDCCAC